MRRILAAAALLLAAACSQARLRPPVDGGLTCAEGERVVDGACRFVCERDRDCPAGEACNLLFGTCEPAAPRPDAGPAVVPCTAGAVRCAADNKGVETCGDAGTWTVTESCPPGGYCQEEQCLACQPGARACGAGGELRLCADDGSAVTTVTCAAGASCAQGECRACEPNTTRCLADGSASQACTRQADDALSWTWVNSGDAFDGTCVTGQCQVTNGTAACVPAECFPGTTQCKSATVQQACSDKGKWQESACSTQPGMGPLAECLGGVCVDECADAAAQKSYFGCEYWSAVQDNPIDAFFTGVSAGVRQGTSPSVFAFVAANRSGQPATLTVTRWMNGAEQVAATATVPPRTDPQSRGLAVVYVPWQSIGAASATAVSTTGKEKFGYRISSTRPVALYQFNPLDSVKVGNKGCTAAEGASDNNCNEASPKGTCRTTAAGAKRCHYYTYSNDASLLLPRHILGTSYVAVAPSHVKSRSPKLFGGWNEYNVYNTHLTVVATTDNTQVTLSSRAKLVSGSGTSVPPKGSQQVYTLNRYDVLQVATDNDSNIQCAVDPGDIWGDDELCRVNNDLSGSLVSASAPVAVFGGSGCSFVPYSTYACDHLEEQLFPFDSWGKSFVAVHSHPLRVSDTAFASATNAAPDYYKVVASCPASQCPNGTTVQVSGSASQFTVLGAGSGNGCLPGTSLGNAAAPCRLAGGTFVEFSSKSSFTLASDQPVAVAQFFAGQDATTGTPAPVQGDPSMILLPPAEQWRSTYTVLAAPGIRDNYLGLAVDDTKVQEVRVDGVAVTGFTPVGSTTFKVLNAPVSVGTHTVEVVAKPGQSAPGAGVTVYGFDSYVSYGYAGGLDLKSIVVGVNPGG